jgi:hypothetical protein
MVQHIGLYGESEEIKVTLLVRRLFSDLPGESKGCASDVRTTAESRFSCYNQLTVTTATKEAIHKLQ